MLSFRYRYFASVVLLVPACVFLLLGCGGSGEGGESAAADRPLTKAEFMKEAESICRKGVAVKDRKFPEVAEGLDTSAEPSPAELAYLVERVVIEPYSKSVAEFGRLHLPPGDEVAAEIVRGYESALKETEADPAKSVQTSPFVEIDKKALAYGLKSCVL